MLQIKIQAKLHKKDFFLDADFCVPLEGITAIWGASGCGKTTLLRVIAGLEPNAKANICIGKKQWQTQNSFIPAHQRSIGYVFQESGLFPHLNIRDNVEYGYRRTPVNKRKLRLADLIKIMNIEEFLDKMPFQLSGGQRQRVAMAQSLATSPQLLLLDEPLSALDQHGKRNIIQSLKTLKNELHIPIIYVSHSHDEITSLANHIVFVDQGKVSATGAVNDVLTRPDLPFVYESNSASVIAARVTSHDEEYGLTRINFEGLEMLVPQMDLDIGQAMRIKVFASDISLNTTKSKTSTILNILPAHIHAMNKLDRTRMLITLKIGEQFITAHITQKSVDALHLRNEMNIYAQIKTLAAFQ